MFETMSRTFSSPYFGQGTSSSSTISAAIRAGCAGAHPCHGAKLFFLPKYSPDLNPIEQVFAKLMHLLRKAAARTVEAVCAAIGELLGAFTAKECANYSGTQAMHRLKIITL
jgi:hypothetical protein